MDKKQPEKTIQYGRVKAAVWSNQGENGYFRSITLARSYKDDKGEYQNSNSFSLWDLINVIRCTLDAMTYMSPVDKEKAAA